MKKAKKPKKAATMPKTFKGEVKAGKPVAPAAETAPIKEKKGGTAFTKALSEKY